MEYDHAVVQVTKKDLGTPRRVMISTWSGHNSLVMVGQCTQCQASCTPVLCSMLSEINICVPCALNKLE